MVLLDLVRVEALLVPAKVDYWTILKKISLISPLLEAGSRDQIIGIILVGLELTSSTCPKNRKGSF